MNNSCDSNEILEIRNGTSQSQRYIAALDPGTIELHDFTTEDWMRFALRFSEKVNYYDTATNKKNGQWDDFFIQEEEIPAFVEKVEKLNEQAGETGSSDKDIDPHLTLFVAFLKLTSFAQKRLNKLPKKHLDYYYKEVLKLDKKTPVEDQVHILFELAKNASEVKIEQFTALDGKKDKKGVKRIYKTQDEIVVNKASVASLRNVFHEDGVGIKYALKADSYDGLGKDFPDNEIRWWPFGYPSNTPGITRDGGPYPDLPFAKIGFGLSSPVLLLREGKRIVTFTFALSGDGLHTFKARDLKDALDISFSGEKEWITSEIITGDHLPAGFSDAPSSITANALRIVVLVHQGADPIVNYDKEVLLEPYNTGDPVARFIIKNSPDSDKGYGFLQLYAKALVSSVRIDVSADEIQDVAIENDLGVLDASKPFFPFGPQPLAGSNFYVGLPEAMNKNWTKISVDFTWKDTPLSFVDRYRAYKSQFKTGISKNRYTLTLDSSGNIAGESGLTNIVQNDNHFTAKVHVLEHGIWKVKQSAYDLFGGDALTVDNIEAGTGGEKFAKISGLFLPVGSVKAVSERIPEKEKFTAAAKKGFIRISLVHSFLHEMYPKLLSVALSKKGENILVPDEPYTPLVETMKICYSATAETEKEDVKLFHEHPFGVSEESRELKDRSILKNAQKVIKLLPTYINGSLFIALEHAKNLQSVALLVQTLEGSENPETDNDFAEGEKLVWSILCSNEWLPLDSDYISINSTDNFLKTGIVKLTIPGEATQDNTKLPSGYFWIKADNSGNFDAVSQLVDVNAQAVLAKFEHHGNELSHLKYGLPAGTISKLTERLANVKGVAQKFASFDGRPEEADEEFYRRISERLRHKQRAITTWDYEHLILQKFTYIFKAYCLNHTLLPSYLSPGDVTVVVIPNIINQNVYDPYKPRISKAKRNEIREYINRLNTLHVTAEVINPEYKEVKIHLKVRFYAGKDERFHASLLRTDIAKLLAPWAFEETSSIDFGKTFHESSVIDYLEKLEYVDYITDFQMLMETGSDATIAFSPAKSISPSGAQVILTSVKPANHKVEVISPAETCPAIVPE
ncbi:MAG: baseplate J/gp47 family protein [Cytophagales bacterium]|nr:baseplate J/gp47 family protein [Cytophagales bacterium]